MHRLLVAAAVSTLLVVTGCSSSPGPAAPAPAPASGEWFRDGAAAAGLDFVHFNGMTGHFYFPEVMSAGVGLFDYDNDGDLDVLALQGNTLDGSDPARAIVPQKTPPRARLYRNDGTGPGSLRFTDVTEASRLAATGYGMGVAAGDYDNDGCVDVYLTNFGSNQLWRNNCDGTFTDTTARSGTASPGWSVPAAFVDVDRDGWLDLFVGHYLNYTIASNIPCHSASGQLDYCPPHVYRAQPSHLYRNNRNGTFTDITAAAGLAVDFGPALGIATADYDGDGWIDLFVANDSTANNLWINQRNGTFKDTAWAAGVAVSPEGLSKASMGIDAGDMDNDGDEDVFVTELTTQGIDLYVNDGSAVFTDASARAGLRVPTLPMTGFGTAWFDYDNDGWLDVATVNGRVTHTEESLVAKDWYGLKQRRQLFRNLGGGRFEDVTPGAGQTFALEEIGRGAAFGDVDNDGDTDVVVSNDAGPLRLFLNQVGTAKNWVGVRLVGGGDRGRDMLGARVAIVQGGTTTWRRARSDGSYASANDPRILVGLGDRTDAPTVRVVWPGGRVEEWPGVPVRRYTTLVEGTGTAVVASTAR